MKTRIFSVFLSLVSWPALAADLGSGPMGRSVPAVIAPAVYNWSGIYIGANGGYAFGNGAGTLTLTGNPFIGGFSTGKTSMNGALGGGQIGGNWQAGMLVVGAELDAQASGQANTGASGCGFGCTINEKISTHWLSTGRARIGVAIDRVLLYGTGGAAWGDLAYAVSANGAGLSVGLINLTQNKIGWTAGAGIEVGITDYLSVKAEYLFVSIGDITASSPFPAALGGGTVGVSAKMQSNIARVGLNLRWPAGGAVVARY